MSKISSGPTLLDIMMSVPPERVIFSVSPPAPRVTESAAKKASMPAVIPASPEASMTTRPPDTNTEYPPQPYSSGSG